MKSAYVLVSFSGQSNSFVTDSANPSATLPLGIGALVSEWYQAQGTTLQIPICPADTIPNALDLIKLQKFWEGIDRKGPQAA
jgi:hypothetical protein